MLELPSKEIKVGCILPLTGSMSEIAERCRRGHEIAVQIQNEKGGIKSLENAKVVYEYANCGDRPEGAVSECERLIKEEKVPVITGCYASSLTLPAVEIAEHYKVPFVVSDATANELTERGFRYVFRASANNTLYCNSAIDFGVKVLKAKTLGIVYIDLLIGQMLEAEVKRRAKERGIKVVMNTPYEQDTKDFSDIVSKMKSVDPDLIVAASYVDDAVLMAHEMHRQNCNVRAFVGMGAGHAIPEFLRKAGKDSEYFASVAYWCHDMKTPGSADLARRYAKNYGEFPIEHPGSCFQASEVLLNGLEKSGSANPERIREALTKTDLMTICGRVRMDRMTGQNINAKCIIVQVQKGQFRTIWPNDVASGKLVFPPPIWSKRD